MPSNPARFIQSFVNVIFEYDLVVDKQEKASKSHCPWEKLL